MERSGDWGPFEEERLELMAQYLHGASDDEGAARVRGELLERFPTSAAASRIREREAADAAAKASENQPPKPRP